MMSSDVAKLIERLRAWSLYSYHEMHQEEARSLFGEAADALESLTDTRGEDMRELEQGKDELRRLIESIWRAEYRHTAPEWKALPDLVGMVTQVDNMYAGVRSQRDEARWHLAGALERCAKVAEDHKALGYMSDRERDYCIQHGEEIAEAIRSLPIIEEERE